MSFVILDSSRTFNEIFSASYTCRTLVSADIRFVHVLAQFHFFCVCVCVIGDILGEYS